MIIQALLNLERRSEAIMALKSLIEFKDKNALDGHDEDMEVLANLKTQTEQKD